MHPNVPRQFSPNRFVDISDYLEQKLEGLECYEGELRESVHPRSREGVCDLARFRGRTVGVAAAEAFEIIRQIS